MPDHEGRNTIRKSAENPSFPTAVYRFWLTFAAGEYKLFRLAQTKQFFHPRRQAVRVFPLAGEILLYQFTAYLLPSTFGTIFSDRAAYHLGKIGDQAIIGHICHIGCFCIR